MRWAWRRYADERRLRQRDKERAGRARCGKGTGKMMALARPRTVSSERAFDSSGVNGFYSGVKGGVVGRSFLLPLSIVFYHQPRSDLPHPPPPPPPPSSIVTCNHHTSALNRLSLECYCASE